ncbi:type II secretion system protein [Chitinibacteraceae bacterium HSL-7]
MPALISRQRAFSLLEMAAVLMIFSLLLTTVMGTVQAQQENRRRADTRALLDAAESSLIGFAIQRGRLPAPANPAATGATAGLEDTSRVHGVLPWVTLGLPELDGWQHRITYSVAAGFADTDITTPADMAGCIVVAVSGAASFSWCDEGNLKVTDSANKVLADKMVAVLVSHDANGAGAYLSNGTQVPGASGCEAENADADTLFIYDRASCDDQVRWLSAYRLDDAMLRAGRLP